MNKEIKKALNEGRYICPYCAREEEKIRDLVALTWKKLVYHCPTCQLNFSIKTIEDYMDTADEEYAKYSR